MNRKMVLKSIFYSPWTFVFLVLIIILSNLIVIDLIIFIPQQNNSNNTQLAVKPTSLTPTLTVSAQTKCLEDCKNEIEKVVRELIKPTLKNEELSNLKEFFIPLGTGSGNSLEWTDVAGMQAYIDKSLYKNIKSVTFEASLYTPTANQEAYIRLYNATDSHPVWNSDIHFSNSNHELKISAPITLDNNSKLYQVQVKTQLGSRANIENARIRILTY